MNKLRVGSKVVYQNEVATIVEINNLDAVIRLGRSRAPIAHITVPLNQLSPILQEGHKDNLNDNSIRSLNS